MRFSTAMSAFCMASSRCASTLSTSCSMDSCDPVLSCATTYPGHAEASTAIASKIRPPDIEIPPFHRVRRELFFVRDQRCLVSDEFPLPLELDEHTSEPPRLFIDDTVILDCGIGAPVHDHRVSVDIEMVFIGVD